MRPGYKQTEVGVIPEEWEVVSIGDLASFSSGSGIKLSSLRGKSTDTPIPVYGGNGISGYTHNALVNGATVVVGRVGQKCGEVYLTPGPAWITDNALYPWSLHREIDARFLALALAGAGLNDRKNRNDLPLITQSILHSVLIAWPPREEEQRAIAVALSDVDALLNGLDRLIAKKRDLKQAAMQRLLTGRTRLPGFSGEWEVKQLRGHVGFLKNGTHSRADLTGDGSLKYLHYGDIHTSTRVALDPRLADMPSLPRERGRTLDRLHDGDLVFVDASEDLDGVGKSVEITGTSSVDVVAGLHTIAARFDTAVLADGFKGYLQFLPAFRAHLIRLAAGTKVYATNRAHIASAEIPLPGTREQTAIADVLSDMDAELAALEQRCDKTRALKQAMMQELLTGRTRLV